MQMSLVVAPSQQKETTKIHMHWSISQQTKKWWNKLQVFRLQRASKKQQLLYTIFQPIFQPIIPWHVCVYIIYLFIINKTVRFGSAGSWSFETGTGTGLNGSVRFFTQSWLFRSTRFFSVFFLTVRCGFAVWRFLCPPLVLYVPIYDLRFWYHMIFV